MVGGHWQGVGCQGDAGDVSYELGWARIAGVWGAIGGATAKCADASEIAAEGETAQQAGKSE